jgi:small subunit ribosomal protein S13
MVYIFNKYIPPKKNIKIASTEIYGIGSQRATEITKNLGINSNKRFGTLKDNDISKITKYISNNYKVASFLKKAISETITQYVKIRHYKGIRHEKGLPVRGQRTHTNAQTIKKMNLIKLVKKNK